MAEISIVVPVFNEIANVKEVVKRVTSVMDGIDWELIFVDDNSPDGTADLAWEQAGENPRVRCIKRVKRRGLSSAVIEGMLSTAAPYIAVMDGDLQHDETILPNMLAELKQEGCDVVIGSRYIEGGGTGDWSEGRRTTSRLATRVAQIVSKVDIQDPMSGFFMIRRHVIHDTVMTMSQRGYKILLDIVLSSKKTLTIKEYPYEFRSRLEGESKLSFSVIWEFGMMMADKMIGRYIPARFMSFAMVGALGAVVHFLILTIAMSQFGQDFQYGQMTATVTAMVFNYILNNNLTFSDRRLRGFAFWKGLVSFMVISSMGAVSNVGVSVYLYEANTYWVTSAIVGIFVGAVWNYTVSSIYTWKTAVK